MCCSILGLCCCISLYFNYFCLNIMCFYHLQKENWTCFSVEAGWSPKVKCILVFDVLCDPGQCNKALLCFGKPTVNFALLETWTNRRMCFCVLPSNNWRPVQRVKPLWWRLSYFDLSVRACENKARSEQDNTGFRTLTWTAGRELLSIWYHCFVLICY